MANSLSNYNIPWLETFIKTSIAFSKYFKDTRQRKNFINFLRSLSLTGSCLLNDIGQVSSIPKHHSRSLSHFFNKTNWDEQYFENKRKELVLNYLLKDIIAIALDSTALAKSGKHFENQGAVYDSRINKVTDGFPMLIATGITEQSHYSPIDYLRYSEKDLEILFENQIKLDFVKRLVDLFSKDLKMPVFVADSGFLRKCIVVYLLENDIPFLIKTVNRKVILKSGKKTLTNQLKSGTYENVKIATQGWKDICGNLVVGPFDKDKGNRRVFMTNLCFKDYSKSEALKFYQKRWFVEESIKDLKQNFDLENFRVRSWHGSQKQIALIFFATTLTHLALLKHNKWTQYVLPQFIKGLCDNFCFSVYHCRKMLLKMLFCGQAPVLANDYLINYCHSP